MTAFGRWDARCAMRDARRATVGRLRARRRTSTTNGRTFFLVSSTASAAPPSLSPPFFPPFFFFANAMCRPEDRRTGEGALSTWVPAWGIAGLYRPAFGAIRITDTLMTRPDIGSVDMTMARETEEGCEIKIGQLGP